MNEIINWIAVNNTLLIRIGFTAILVLSIIYVYRFFFVASITTVEAAENAATAPLKVTEKNKAEEKKTEAMPVAAKFSESEVAVEMAAAVKEKDVVIEQLKSEVDGLKSKVTKAETEVATLTKQKAEGGFAATSAAQNSAVAATSIGSETEKSSDSDLIASLNSKIEQLQARLTEYEIIAEDISEIGQLREENEVLRKRQALDAPLVKAEPAAVPAQPALAEVPVIEDPEDVAEAEPNGFVPSASNSERLADEGSVSLTEQQLINEFEEISNKKGS